MPMNYDLKPQIKLDYLDSYLQWYVDLTKIVTLENKQIYSSQTFQLIIESLNKQIFEFLLNLNKKPKCTKDYKQNLVNFLRRKNKYISIETNRNFWLYIDTFVDLEDYSKAFDIEIKNIEIKNINTEVNKNYETNRGTTIKRKY